MRLVTLEGDDQTIDLGRQLVGVADRPPRAIGQGLEPVLFIAVENLVAGFAGDAELAAEIRHRLSLQKTGDEAQALFHASRLKTKSVTHVSGTKCHLCRGPLIFRH
jgi:hypothetical protein